MFGYVTCNSLFCYCRIGVIPIQYYTIHQWYIIFDALDMYVVIVVHLIIPCCEESRYLLNPSPNMGAGRSGGTSWK